MKKFAIKAVVAAVGALSALAVQAAAVDLDAASPTTIKYASERIVGTSVNLRHGAAADQTATVKFGASLGQNVAAYVRIDLEGGVFNGNVDADSFAVNDNVGAATVNVAQGGATGGSFVIFSVTPANGNNLVAGNDATIDTDVTGAWEGITVTNKDGVKLRYRLYETLTAAANEGSALKGGSTAAKPYISFASALSQTVSTPSTAPVADVGTTPSYKRFTPDATTALAQVVIKVDDTIAVPSGAAATPAALLTANSDVAVNGDFTFARNLTGTAYVPADGRVFLRAGATTDFSCSVGGASVNPTTLTASKATWSDIAAATLASAGTGTRHVVCLAPSNDNEIVAGTYNADINYEPQTDYTATDVTGAAFGEVTRNGATLIAPLTNQPAGWYSRLVLVNSGSSARSYTVTPITETGTTVNASGDAVQGSIPANTTKVINLQDPNGTSLFSITPAAGLGVRTAVKVVVNGPTNQVTGSYQIVNSTGASISNQSLVVK